MNNTTTSSNQHPVNNGQISIRTKMLHPYVANDYLTLVEWEDSLRRMAAERGFIASGYRLLYDNKGALLLNLKFAQYFAYRASISAKGAIARVILNEGLIAAENGDPNYINHILARFGNIGLVAGLVQGLALHSFLKPHSVFDEWFAQEKQRCRFVYGRDYIRASVTDTMPPTLHKRNTGKGEIYFRGAATELIIMNDQAPRGIMTQEYMSNRMLHLI